MASLTTTTATCLYAHHNEMLGVFPKAKILGSTQLGAKMDFPTNNIQSSDKYKISKDCIILHMATAY